jgi:DNA replication protein DnaC
MKEQTLPSWTLIREGYCDGCEYPIKVYETEILGGPKKGEKTEVTYGCKCEDIKIAKQALANKRKDEIRKVRKHFDSYSLISKKLKKATLENYKPQNKSQAIAKRSVEKFIDTFDLDEPMNILFTGGYGVGKSHLAKALTDGIMEKTNPNTEQKYRSIFISVPKLLRKIRATYNPDSDVSEDDIFSVLEDVDVLVLDDIGAERQSDWTDERLFDLIDSRQGMHTIYTSNYGVDDLMELLEERNFSRVVNEDTYIIKVEGKNYRLSDLQ